MRKKYRAGNIVLANINGAIEKVIIAKKDTDYIYVVGLERKDNTIYKIQEKDIIIKLNEAICINDYFPLLMLIGMFIVVLLYILIIFKTF